MDNGKNVFSDDQLKYKLAAEKISFTDVRKAIETFISDNILFNQKEAML
jgi:hypothetical protein